MLLLSPKLLLRLTYLLQLPWGERVDRWKTLSSLLQLYLIFRVPHSSVIFNFQLPLFYEQLTGDNERTACFVFLCPTLFCGWPCMKGGRGRRREEREKKQHLTTSSSIFICLLNDTDNVGRISSVELLSKLSEDKHRRRGSYSSWHSANLHSTWHCRNLLRKPQPREIGLQSNKAAMTHWY